MKYCMKCGVKVDEAKNRKCPLCQTIILTDEELKLMTENIQTINQDIKREEKEIVQEEVIVKEKKDKLSVTSYIMFLSSITSIFILLIIDLAIGFNIDFSIIPILSILLFLITVCVPFMRLHKPFYWYITLDSIVLCVYFLLMNLIINQTISWSYYVVLSIMLTWIYLSSIFVNKIKGFVLRIAMNFIATAIFVLLVSLGLSHYSGFSRLALPINGLIFILTVISYLFIKTYIYNWKVIITTLSINISILCLGIDLLIQHYLHRAFFLKWSYIVLLVLIPFTLFMLYLDNRYKVHQYILKKFHF